VRVEENRHPSGYSLDKKKDKEKEREKERKRKSIFEWIITAFSAKASSRNRLLNASL
jgi:hypothetical protein